MKPITISEVAAALGQSFADGMGEGARLNVRPVVKSVPARRLAAPTVPERVAAVDEEVEAVYRSFAESLGITDDESDPSQRFVSLPQAEYDTLKAEADRLPGLLRDRSRPADRSDEDEQQYRRWALDMGLE